MHLVRKLDLKGCDINSIFFSDPTLVYLTQTSLLNLIQKGLCQLLHRIDKTNSYYRSKTFLNGIDFLAEFLYNMNPKYLERHSSKINIFDMDWVKNILAERYV